MTFALSLLHHKRPIAEWGVLDRARSLADVDSPLDSALESPLPLALSSRDARSTILVWRLEYQVEACSRGEDRETLSWQLGAIGG